MNNHRLLWWWMLPILLLTTYLGANYLVYDVLWMDEWFSYLRSGGGPFEPFSIPEIIQRTITFLSWPPAYFLSLAAWTNSFGGTLFVDRAFSLFLGLLTISAIYRLGKVFHSRVYGLLAAFLLSTSAFFVYYLHELRPYTLYILAVTLSAWLYWQLLTNPKAGRGTAWGFVLSVALSLYTHYIASLCIASIAIYHIFFAYRDLSRPHWRRILRLGINGCVLFTPWVAIMLISVYNETLADRGEPLPMMLYNIALSFTNNMAWLLLLALLTLRWWKNRAVRFSWVWIVTVIVLTILGNAYADFLFHPRHVLGILPMIVLLIAFTLLFIAQWKREAAALLLGLWVGTGLLYSLSPLPFVERIPAHLTGIKRTANDTIVEIGETCIQNDDVAFYGLTLPEEAHSFDVPLNNYLANVHYLYNHISSITSDVEHHSLLFPETFTKEFFEQSPQTRLQQVTQNADTVWVFALPDVPLQEELLHMNNLLLNAGYSYCGAVVDRPDLLGTLYTRDAAMCQQLITSCVSGE